eukprot:3480278-Prymnesium_polylepis.1
MAPIRLSETGMVLVVFPTSADQTRREARIFPRDTGDQRTHRCSRIIDRYRRAQPPPPSLAMPLALMRR